MNTRLVLRYGAAGLVSFVCFAVACITYAIIDDSDYTPLALVRFVGFLVVFAGAFCFPFVSRPFRSLVLLALCLLIDCSTSLLYDDDFHELTPFPCFVPLAQGGTGAVAVHSLIYLVYAVVHRLTRSLQPTAVTPGG